MELLIGIGVLVLLAILALRYGTDSRTGLSSAEHALAARGYAHEREPQAVAEATNGPAAALQDVSLPASSAASGSAPGGDRALAA